MTDLGPVSIESRPERVVSLSATHTEIIYELAVDEQLVAVDLISNYPPAAADNAKLDSFSFNVEEVAALDPDLVIIAFDFQGEAAALAAVDIPFLLLGPPVDLDGMYQQFRVIGDALGVPGAGEALATRAEERARAISADAQSIAGQRFFHEVDDTYYTATSASFIGDVYSSLVW
jgi:iron complex transport system substrate-binding protein